MTIATTKAAEIAIRRAMRMTERFTWTRPEYRGQYLKRTRAGELWTFSGAYMILTSPDPLPGLPRLDTFAQLDPLAYIDRMTTGRSYAAPAEIPTRSQLDAFRRSAGPRTPYQLQGSGEPVGVNPQYLRDLLTIYPGAGVTIAGPLDPIIIRDDAGEPVAALAPVRLPQKDAAPASAE